MNRGKLLIALIFAVAIGMAGYAIWFRYQRSNQVVRLWSMDVARSISQPEKAELLWIEPAVVDGDIPDAGVLRIDDVPYRIIASVDALEARGFKNIRNALLQDAGYDWTTTSGTTDENVADRLASGNLSSDTALTNDELTNTALTNTAPACQPKWSVAMRFHRKGLVHIFAIDLDCERIRLLGTQRQAKIPGLAAGMRLFFQDHFPGNPGK